jgi:hypothetical protein
MLKKTLGDGMMSYFTRGAASGAGTTRALPHHSCQTSSKQVHHHVAHVLDTRTQEERVTYQNMENSLSPELATAILDAL